MARHRSASLGLGIWRICQLLGCGVLSGACLGGQTGTENNDDGRGVDMGGACEASSRPLAPDEVSLLGFSASELAQNLSGQRVAPLLWGSASDALGFGPEQGEAELTLELAPRLTSGKWIEFVSKNPEVGCPLHEVSLDFDYRLTTSGGALDEQGILTLHAQASDSARFELSLDLASLRGSFAVTPSAGQTRALLVNAELGGRSMRGTLSGLVEQRRGDVTGAMQVFYACWPSDDASCAKLAAPGR